MGVPATEQFEKLGTFYLGRGYDLEARAVTPEPVLYDARDLVTHGVCVGMTGSGKTGLCVALLEEAAIDGIPAIIVDPKGDLSNLLLTFPALDPASFRPWINEDDARRKGVSPEDFARSQAELWQRGLAEWGQDGARIDRLRAAADFAIYTPGSAAGLRVSVLRSFDPPAAGDDPELIRERIAGTASSILGLLGIEADPIQSREHIFLSAILADAWNAGRALDVPGLIARVQQPGFDKIGVMELESVYPAKDRFGLAMALNNLIASPGFSAWTEGEPLDIGAMLYTPTGKPRHAIFSIAHLSDAERMFFVSMLLNQVLSWVRSQPGTTSLRALLYMDEIAGYVPPVANPPSKRPLLTLMKQARAFGFGVMLATQNPVDLDYKGLSNAGTWFIGRLQTDRDKQRVLDGLEGASVAGLDRAEADRILSSLGPRVFLMHNVHDERPTVMHSRWCLSYLRGPMTRAQISTLMSARAAADRPASPPNAGLNAASHQTPQAPSAATARVEIASTARPVLPPEVPQYFLPRASNAAGELVYRPMLMGTARVYYSDARLGVECNPPVSMLAALSDGPVVADWDHATIVGLGEDALLSQPDPGLAFAPLPGEATKPRSFDSWKRAFADAVFRSHRLELWRCEALGLVGKPDESERDFRARLALALREQRDAEVERLRATYAPKLEVLRDRLRRAEQTVEVQREQASGAKVQSALSFGAAVLGAFLGRKAVSAGTIGRATSAARSVHRSKKESSDVGRAEENAASIRARMEALDAEFQEEAAAIVGELEASAASPERVSLKPKKAGINVRAVVLAWAPHERAPDGTLRPLYF